jgi:hypothetical protein
LWIFWDNKKGWIVYDVDKLNLIQVDTGNSRSLLFVRVLPTTNKLVLALNSNTISRYTFISEQVLDTYIDEIRHYYYENDYANMARTIERMISDFYYKILKV